MNDPELVGAVVKYKQKRAEIKALQRQELEDKLAPWAADVGDEIIRVRSKRAASVQDVADIIGIQNRTFIYSMIRAAEERAGTRPDPTPEPQEDNVVRFPNYAVAPEYSISYFDGVASVAFGPEESYDIVVIDGVPDLPEEWAEHTATRRALYKEIVQEIKNHGWD